MAGKQDPLPETPATPEEKRLETVQIRKDKAWEHPQLNSGDWLSKIVEVLLSENLVVLSGLGTSLCIKNGDKTLAPTMGDLWDKAKKIDKFADVLKKVGYPESESNIEELMSRCQMYGVLHADDEVSKFVKEAERAIQESCLFAVHGQSLPVHEMFLRKVARRSSRQPRLRLFTTNYDLCYEVAAANAGFVVVDGFSHSSPQIFDGSYFSYDLVRRDTESENLSFIPNVFQLLKLHGSVDWERAVQGQVIRKDTEQPIMVFPRIGKYESSFQQPFFEVMSRFQSALRQPNTGLLVLGYGFRDKHLNEPILAAWRSNVGLKCAVVNPALAGDEENEVHKALIGLIDGGDVRLNAIAAKFEDFVEHMPDLVALSEEELHQARTRQLFNL
ncbi:MAG TPA: SIR2 family protein [Fimbriimonadaceae bacterium]|mgnify:CR=1 FL=1|nr:SIR2 family protein [Fimbriimonadaceae bacterium]HRJ32488.1 SIR2 family protein [Fimbriimonadaceae bacterium]